MDLPRFGNINLHGSLLPSIAAPAPIQWAVASGETETGVTMMRIDAGLDTGDILCGPRSRSVRRYRPDAFPAAGTRRRGVNLTRWLRWPTAPSFLSSTTTRKLRSRPFSSTDG